MVMVNRQIAHDERMAPNHNDDGKTKTDDRRLRLRRVRRVRAAEASRFAIPFANDTSPGELLHARHSDATKSELDPIDDMDDDWFADNQNEWLWDCTTLNLDDVAASERSRFHATIGDATR
jgi:hypothetical protein